MGTCKQCGAEFQKKRKEQILCSTACQGLYARRVQVRTCERETCGNTFEATPSDYKRYCGRSCSAKVFNLGVSRNKTTGKYSNKPCAWCDKVTDNPKYCSTECFGEAKKARTVEMFIAGLSVNINNASIYDYLMSRQDNKCFICSISPEWNGSPLVFIRDHADGNPDNHDPDNVRLLCSNCDSQLDTYKAKNLGRGRHYRRQRYAEGKSY